jgi:hypothetical protein
MHQSELKWLQDLFPAAILYFACQTISQQSKKMSRIVFMPKTTPECSM